MGGWFSSSKSTDNHQTAKSTGGIVNNVLIEEPVHVHDTDKVILLLSLLCILQLISLIIYIYKSFVKHLKKKYGGQNNKNGQV